MDIAVKLCTQLGYQPHEGSQVFWAKILLDELKTFASSRPSITNTDAMTTEYLAARNSASLPMYSPTPGVTTLITNLLAQIFDHITQSRASQHQIIDLMEDGVDEAIGMNTVALQENSSVVDQSSTDWPDSIARPDKLLEVKQEPSRFALRQASMRRNNTERQTDEQRWRFETPPLSSLDTVKKRRWPPQWVSPPSTPHSKGRKTKTRKRRNIGGHLAKQRRSRTSSPELLSSSPITPSPAFTRSDDSGKAAPATPPKTPVKNKSTRGPKASRLLAPKPIDQSDLEPLVTKVVFHFFLSDESLGAVPVGYDQCKSFTRFFMEAKAAWGFFVADKGKTSMAGVSVTIDGLDWPMVISWKDPKGYNTMMESIEAAKADKTGDLLVKVKCIKK